MTQRKGLVTTEWLAEHLDAPDVRIVDGSWYLPADGRDPRAEYAERHIPGAVFFDIDDISDEKSPLPHMLPSAEKFPSRVRKLGLGDGVTAPLQALFPPALFPPGCGLSVGVAPSAVLAEQPLPRRRRSLPQVLRVEPCAGATGEPGARIAHCGSNRDPETSIGAATRREP